MLGKYTKIAFIFFILTTLCSCGFKPLHSNLKSEYSHHLENIYIEPLDSISGSEYYEAISNILPNCKEPKYSLITQLSFEKDISVLLPNSDVIHEEITARAHYRLVRKDDGKELTSGKTKKSLSYSTTFAPYTNNVRSEDATIKLSRSLAEEVRNRLLFYFVNNHENIQQ